MSCFADDGPNALELKMALAGWSQGAIQGMHVLSPAQVYFELTRKMGSETQLPPQWRTFVDKNEANHVRERLGLNRAEKAEKAEKTNPKEKR